MPTGVLVRVEENIYVRKTAAGKLRYVVKYTAPNGTTRTHGTRAHLKVVQ